MNTSKKIVSALFVGISALLPPGAVAGAGNFVANPESGVYADWSPKKLSGKDYWIALGASWHNLKGVSHEKFVKDSCLWAIRLPFRQQNNGVSRTGIIREIELLDSANQNHANRAKFHLSTPEKGTLFLYPENLNDRKKHNMTVISADNRALKKRFRSVRGTFTVSADPSVKVKEVRLYHGNRKHGELQTVTLCNKSTRTLALESVRNTYGTITLKLKQEIPLNGLQICFVTKPYKISLGDFPPAVAEKLQKMPFTVPDLFRMTLGDLMGLQEENIDRKSFQHFTEKYKNTFLGFGISEFDSNYGQIRRPNNPRFDYIKGYVPRKDRNREEAVTYMQNLWNYHLDIFGRPVHALSGGIMGSPYMAEWGANAVILELSPRTDRSSRTLMMSVKSAGKQYQIPWGFYLAYYALAANPHSQMGNHHSGSLGEDYGAAASTCLRETLMNYYFGGNLQWFESQVWGQVKKNKDGTHTLTGNGKAIKELYDWISTPEGKRGICYSPVLLLLDYQHGQTCRPEWKVWYHLPMKDGDYMAKHIFNTISKAEPGTRYVTPQHCIAIPNSEFGDIFDMFFANPPSGEITPEELGKFAVVILADDIRFTPRLKTNLKEYVKNGGTLVINSGHFAKFGPDPAFLGFEHKNSYVSQDDMKIAQLRLGSARSLVSRKNLPLLTRNRYGKGAVLCTTPYFMLKNSNKRNHIPLLYDLMKKIQSEVLPVQVKGDVQFILNKMEGNHWKLILVNNRGVEKNPYSSVEKIHAKYNSPVTVTVPGGVSVTEVYAKESLKRNGKEYTLTVPAGSFRVLDLKNVKFGTPLINAKPFRRKPRIQRWKDIYPSEDIKDQPVKDKKIIAEWTFREGKGKVVKDSVSGLQIKLYNNPQFVKTTSGYALKMDGKKTYGYGTLPFRADKNRELSMEIWVKPNLAPGSAWTTRTGKPEGMVIHHNYRAFSIGRSGNQWQYVVSRDALIVENSGKVLDQWTQFVFTWKGFTAKFYVNGKEVIPQTGTFKSSSLGQNQGYLPIYLGTHYYRPGSGESRVFNGLIGELRYFNYALTPEEIKNKLKAGRIKYSE